MDCILSWRYDDSGEGFGTFPEEYWEADDKNILVLQEEISSVPY
jgi:hypothetical protein